MQYLCNEMNFYLSNLLSSIIEETSKARFSTSLEVVQRVMGVPMIAVQNIARNIGVNDNIKGSACIDENALVYFADAYARKMKAYFNRTRCAVNRLSPDEQRAFFQFCDEFKKTHVLCTKLLTWNDIDEEAIREQFIYEVKKQTTNIEVQPASIFKYIASDISVYCLEPLEHIAWEHEIKEKRAMVMRKVMRSYLYNAKISKPKSKQFGDDALRLLFVTAHYHVYISSDDDVSADINDNRKGLLIDRFINRSLQIAC